MEMRIFALIKYLRQLKALFVCVENGYGYVCTDANINLTFM